MTVQLTRLAPFRWKVFQVLLVASENAPGNGGEDALRNAEKLIITEKQFNHFCDRHRHIKSFVPELNDLMKDSYLLIDEYWRFMDNDREKLSRSILDVGVDAALEEIKWDEGAFLSRGGVYDWGKGTENDAGCSTTEDPKLQW